MDLPITHVISNQKRLSNPDHVNIFFIANKYMYKYNVHGQDNYIISSKEYMLCKIELNQYCFLAVYCHKNEGMGFQAIQESTRGIISGTFV